MTVSTGGSPCIIILFKFTYLFKCLEQCCKLDDVYGTNVRKLFYILEQMVKPRYVCNIHQNPCRGMHTKYGERYRVHTLQQKTTVFKSTWKIETLRNNLVIHQLMKSEIRRNRMYRYTLTHYALVPLLQG